jgi:hypothetical protein
MKPLALGLLLVFAVGCKSGGASSPDMSPDGPTPPMLPRAPDDHPPLWQIRNYGGPIQPSPAIYTIVWPGSESIGHEVERFVSWMLGSSYWTGTLGEYGVGAGRSLGLITLPTPAPTHMVDSDLRALVTDLVQAGTVTVDSNTQLLFIIPTTTTVSNDLGDSCSYFAGYHASQAVGTQAVAYDVIADCSLPSTELDGLTKTISHEAGEAATDPQPDTGFAAEPPVLQEIGDLCNFDANVPIDVPGDAQNPPITYWVQRQYSGQAAAAGTRDPCLPVPWSRPFWGVAVYPNISRAPIGTAPVTRQAWLEPFAYGDVGLMKWEVLLQDESVHVTPSSGTAHAGDTIPITITISNPSKVTAYEIDVFSQSQLGGSSWWFAYIIIK